MEMLYVLLVLCEMEFAGDWWARNLFWNFYLKFRIYIPHATVRKSIDFDWKFTFQALIWGGVSQ